MKTRPFRKADLIFAAVLLLAAAALFGFRLWRSSRSGALEARLTYGDNSTVMDISLGRDASYDVDTGYYVIHLQVKNGAVRFVDSPCPDHICESYGWISQEDQTATCMPARATIMIIPKE